jgi:hypothetical protein
MQALRAAGRGCCRAGEDKGGGVATKKQLDWWVDQKKQLDWWVDQRRRILPWSVGKSYSGGRGGESVDGGTGCAGWLQPGPLLEHCNSGAAGAKLAPTAVDTPSVGDEIKE